MSAIPEQPRDKRVELILQQLEELPTLPVIAVRVLEVAGNNDSSVPEVVKLIESDQSLSARILQLVHRSDAGVRGEVSSIDRAVVLLGFDAVRSAALAISVFQTFGVVPPSKQGHFNRDDFWKHSVAVACCAELLAQQPSTSSQVVEEPDAFLCGLLHDLGKVALDAALPKSFSKVVEAADLLRGNIADVERSVIGLDHTVVGKRLAERWQLPTIIRDCIWLHGQAPQALPTTVKNPRLINLITLADLLVREQHIGYSGNYTFSMSRVDLTDAVGLTADQIETVRAELVGRVEPRAQALGIGHATSGELYREALSAANKELGRVSGQLAAKNRRLAVRAKYFDALSHFQSELRPDAPPQLVVQAIGQTAVSALETTSCAVFTLPLGQAFAEVSVFDSYGDAFQTTLVDCPARPPRPTPGNGPVLRAGDELEWLLAAVSPRLQHDGRFWICLEAEGECIGGVVWGGQKGEAERLSRQAQELTAIAVGWGLALRMAQIREDARTLAEQLAEANRRLQDAQSEAVRSRMLLGVSEMAAGAAHEMNNPLAVISGRSQLLANELQDPRQQTAAKLIAEQSHRLSEIITDLMDFAKPTPAHIASADAAALIDRALQDSKRRADMPKVNIELTLTELPSVLVDAQQVTAALIEVFDNAFQAIDTRTGRIEINAGFDPYSQRVVVNVTDNGSGMDEAILKRAFDPFFSAKPAGRRRGMGLAKAQRWVEASNGSIKLESRSTCGTRALIFFAAVPSTSLSQPAPDQKAAQ